jgi:AraC-like DNA-binding protein
MNGRYEEHPARLPGAVAWSRTASGAPGSGRVLPDGCMDLIWCDGLLVAGPDTRAHVAAEPPGTQWTGLRFGPGLGPAVFGVPACELRDLRVPLDALWPGGEVRRLTERVAGAADRAAALEAVAADRLRGAPGPDPWCREVVAALRRGEGVAAVAREAALSERQLHRRSLEAFGYGPKTLARVLRMERALRLARGGMPFPRVAAEAGYADQAHLAREVKALAGVPLSALLNS